METLTSADLDLARQLIQGSSEAFERFVEVYYAKVFRYSFTMCGQREDAEEVAQETLMKVFESLDQLREPKRLKPWVFRIAKNACLMKRRKSVFAPKRELSLDELKPGHTGTGEHLEIADWSAVPENIALDSELKQALSQAVERLPDIYKSVFLLRDVEELSTDDCAEVLGVSSNVIKTRLRRARLTLRKDLDEYLRGCASRSN